MLNAISSSMWKLNLPEELKGNHGEILLHIGDIPSFWFPYIKHLIRKLKPDILVHTGDLVDNLKAGRIKEHIKPYKKYAKKLIHYMEKYAKEVYIVPGNNDIEEFIQSEVTKSKIIPYNTSLKIREYSCLLCHRVLDIDGEADYYLYGHGPTGDTHQFKEGKKYYSNVFFAPSILFLNSGKMIQLRKNLKRRY